MASLSPPAATTAGTCPIVLRETVCPVIPAYSRRTKKGSFPRVTCMATSNNGSSNEEPSFLGKFDRRNVLLGLGGLYGAAGLGAEPFVLGAPVSAPDLTKCGKADLPAGALPTNCCPPASTKIVDFKKVANKSGVAQAAEAPRNAPRVRFPLTLDKVVTTLVSRPRKKRSKQEKEDEEEVLVIDGIQFDRSQFVKFDVFVNDEHDVLSTPDQTEFAGSFVNVPHRHNHGGKKGKTCLRLGLTDLLEDLDNEDDDSILVTLAPKAGVGKVTIGGIKIEFVD